MHLSAHSRDVPSPKKTTPAGVEQTQEATALAQRLSGLEAFNAQLTQSIDTLVDSVLQVRDEAKRELAVLERRVRELEVQLHVERVNRDLEIVSRMHPKDRVIVFVASTYFGDNIKYAWLECIRRAEEHGYSVWFLPFDSTQETLVTRLGANCFPHMPAEWTADHVHVALSAAVVVMNDHLMSANPYANALLTGARHVQMWHGVSIKEIGFRNLGPLRGMSPRFARVLRTCGHFTRFIGTTATNEPEWRRWFSFDRYAPIGYPRNDVLHREPGQLDLLNVDQEVYERACAFLAEGRRVYLYAPTFRDANRGKWLLDSGVDHIASAIARNGDLLIVNLHPVEQPLIPELSRQLPQLTFVSPRTDIYPLLSRSSVLITDYSSIMFDYLQLDRPIVLFRPDHADYTVRSRKLFDDKLSPLPGPMAHNARELVSLLESSALSVDEHYGESRRVLASRLYDHCDGKAAERLVDVLLEELELAGASQ